MSSSSVSSGRFSGAWISRTPSSLTRNPTRFRRAERKLKNAPKRNQKPENAPTAEQEKLCAQELVDILNAEAARTLTLTGRQRRVFVQYLLFGKSFENTAIDYYRLYQIKFPS